MLPALRQFLMTVAREDPFGSARPDHRYPICSLYLDTDDLLFYRQYTQGERRRCKLRVRTYYDDPDAPAFLEVKARIDRIITKRRVRLTRQEARHVIGRRFAPTAAGGPSQPNLDYFVDEMALTACKPVVRVRYLREAFVSPAHEPVRVTFDTALQHQATFGPNLALEGGEWMPTPAGGVILEVKFTGRFPSWIEHMVRTFGLTQVRCCKYAMSIEQMLARGGAALRGAGFMRPPTSLVARL
jgi:hypothetical protein